MISETELKRELKRYPRFIKQAIKNKDFDEAFQRKVEMDTIEWILNEPGESNDR